MEEVYKIYVDRLRDGHRESIDETVNADFIDLHDEDLAFEEPVHIEGEAYLADDDFVLRLNIETVALVPCAICNTQIHVPMKISNAYFAIPLADIKSGVYDFRNILREQIVLDAPQHAECKGKCPKRREIAKFLKKEDPTNREDGEEGYQPFADLDLKIK